MKTRLTKVDEHSVRIVLGAKIRLYRTQRGLSLTKLSKSSGVSVSYLTEIEQGKKKPKAEKIAAIAKVLDVSYDELTSLELTRKLAPLGTLLNSNILDELPLKMFGLDQAKLFEFFLNAPDKIGAFLQTLVQLMRLYEMNVEQFFFSALRAYQELKRNYFDELETAADDFRKNLSAITAASLQEYLTESQGITIDNTSLADQTDLASMRSVYVEKGMRLLLNQNLNDRQLTFVLARECGFHFLNLNPRPYTFSYVKPTSFQLILHNYQASYFAGALLMERKKIVEDLKVLFAKKTWNEQYFRGLLHSYQASPEMLLHRMTSLLPQDLGIPTLFFLRFSDSPDKKERYQITKELHLSGLHSPHANLRHEHYCRRWVSLEVLKEVGATQSRNESPVIGIQRSKYINSGKEYLVLAIARPLFPTKEENCSVSIGFELNEATRKKIQFWESVPQFEVNETCERCSLKDCSVRAAQPSVWQAKEARKRKAAALNKLLDGFTN